MEHVGSPCHAAQVFVAHPLSVLQDQVTGKTWYDWAHVFVNGSGLLNTWKWPDIEGLFDFKGDLMHSAKWNHEVDFKNKTIGIIGTGSTSVQILPQLQKVAKKVKVFMRSPTWISPPFGGGENVQRPFFARPGEKTDLLYLAQLPWPPCERVRR